MRALVTGGGGFIGSNLVDALLERGHEVTIVDNFSTGREVNVEQAIANGADLRRADILEPLELEDAFAVAKPEVVFHLAAQIDVRKSLAHPAADARTNVEGTINVLSAARDAGSQRVVNISTGGAIYGTTDLIPTPETVEALPEAPYGQSKYCAERYCGLFSRLFSLPTVTLRLGNVYGPRQDPLGEAGVIAIFCGKLQTGERPTVYGTGEQTRDYVFVGDVVGAALAALDHPEAGREINVATGRESSVLDLLAALREFAGGDFEPELAPPRPGEIDRSCLDVSRARELLGWSAKVDLADGLRRTVDWARSAAASA